MDTKRIASFSVITINAWKVLLRIARALMGASWGNAFRPVRESSQGTNDMLANPLRETLLVQSNKIERQGRNGYGNT